MSEEKETIGLLGRENWRKEERRRRSGNGYEGVAVVSS
jgi:hypothetical protein